MTRSATVWALATALLASACIPDFGAIEVVDDGGPGPFDAGVDAGFDAGAQPVDAGIPDAGVDGGFDAGGGFVPTPIDIPCGVPWTELGAVPPPECADRVVVDIADPLLIEGMALGRFDDGDLIVLFSELDGPDVATVRSRRFGETDLASVVDGPSIEPLALIGDVPGIDLAIAGEPPNQQHVALWYRSDFGHEIQLHTLRGEAFSPPVNIATGVGRSGVVDLAVDSDGRVGVIWHDDASGQTRVRRELPDGSFGRSIMLREDGDPRLVGRGSVSFAAGPMGDLHAGYQYGFTLSASALSYSVGTDEMWSASTTVDNRAVETRLTGVGTDITMQGSDAVMAYLDWRDGVAEVRLARVRGSRPMPEVTTRLMGVFIETAPARHPIAIETDAYGWLHLLVADAGEGQTRLLYQRQTLVGGELQWIQDVVATFATIPEEILVDMKLGPDRRPHIVYWDAPAGLIRYATVYP